MRNFDLAISKYKSLVFDCDGVILNSNKIKTEAFYDVAKVYGHEPALALKNYHIKNGGISRYAKFEYLLSTILDKELNQSDLKKLLDDFSYEVNKSLLSCEVATGLEELKNLTPYANWLIVSGSDQSELRELFNKRSLKKYFEGGIFGSPDNKEAILAREIDTGNIVKPALFIGDSVYDYNASHAAGLDFVFVSQWTEVENYQGWCLEKRIPIFENICSFLE